MYRGAGARGGPKSYETGFLRNKKANYSLHTPASTTAPIAARRVAILNGDFCVTAPAAGGVEDGDGTVISGEET